MDRESYFRAVQDIAPITSMPNMPIFTYNTYYSIIAGGKETTILLSPALTPTNRAVTINGNLRIVLMVSVMYFHNIALR